MRSPRPGAAHSAHAARTRRSPASVGRSAHPGPMAVLMVEQQEDRVVDIDQGLAAAAGKNVCHLLTLSSK
jgi:hypothetical protein